MSIYLSTIDLALAAFWVHTQITLIRKQFTYAINAITS